MAVIHMTLKVNELNSSIKRQRMLNGKNPRKSKYMVLAINLLYL
jgi:hypothetical protein